MELRFYCFVNYYLSSIQQGIQTGHAAVQLLRNYQCVSGEKTTNVKLVESWADDYKTFVTLNGGNDASIKEATEIISKADFPWVTFSEDDKSLGGIQTCVGVVLPEFIFASRLKPADKISELPYYIYKAADFDYKINCVGSAHYDIIKLVTTAPLAR